ncbi:MAG TPA: hypothetical protein VIL46_03855 [Gemmataceae bacterium]
MSAPKAAARKLPRTLFPLELRWDSSARPLPACEVRAAAADRSPFARDAPPWLDSGPPGEPFDFSAHMARLCADIAARCEEFRHIDVGRLLITFAQARNGRRHGLQARVTPMRFRGGAVARRIRGVPFQVQRFFVEGREILYVLSFCLPRFLDQDFDDKLVTLFHELYHISPRFDGDLRRLAGRYCVHSASQKRYDENMAAMAREYLATGPDPTLHAFLRLSFAQLRNRHGRVLALRVPRPKIVPLTRAAPAPGPLPSVPGSA